MAKRRGPKRSLRASALGPAPFHTGTVVHGEGTEMAESRSKLVDDVRYQQRVVGVLGEKHRRRSGGLRHVSITIIIIIVNCIVFTLFVCRGSNPFIPSIPQSARRRCDV